MKNRWIALAGCVAVLGAGTTLGVVAQTGGASNSALAIGQKRERHPELKHAMAALRRAQGFLQHADRDFGGHREKAADLTRQAIAEVEEAIKADKK